MKSVMANEKEVKAYLKKSSVSVCGFGATNIDLQNAKRNSFKRKGPKYVTVKFKFYICYII